MISFISLHDLFNNLDVMYDCVLFYAGESSFKLGVKAMANLAVDYMELFAKTK